MWVGALHLLEVQSIPLRQGGGRLACAVDWERRKEGPGGNAWLPMLWYYKVDVGSSYHCEAEFTKRWIVHPLNHKKKTPIGGNSQVTLL